MRMVRFPPHSCLCGQAANDPIADVEKLRDYSMMRWPYPRAPEIGRNLPSDFRLAEDEFDRRVKSQFPSGTREARLIGRLREQGFKIDDTKGDCMSATVMRGLIIKTLWSIRWRSRDEQIEEIWGVYGAIAP